MEVDQTEPELVTHTTRDAFLRAIHEPFLKCVGPIESSLIDVCRAEDVMTSGDEQELRAEVTRRDKARKLWTLFQKVPLDKFEKVCINPLKKKYPHVIGKNVFLKTETCDQESGCLRHAVMRTMKLKRFADAFIPTKSCTEPEYRKITDCCNEDEEMWDFVFNICARNGQDKLFRENLLNLLKGHNILYSADIQCEFRDGFLCKCLMPGPRRSKRLKLKRKISGSFNGHSARCLKSRRRTSHTVSVSSCGYPASSPDGDEKHSLSVKSSESEKTEDEERSAEKDTQFETYEQREKFLQKVDKINEALENTSRVREFSRKLDRLTDKISILSKPPKDKQDMPDLFIIQGLRIQANTTRRLLRMEFDKAKEVLDAISTEKPLDFHVPSDENKRLLKRQHILKNEVNEVGVLVAVEKSFFTLYIHSPRELWLTFGQIPA